MLISDVKPYKSASWLVSDMLSGLTCNDKTVTLDHDDNCKYCGAHIEAGEPAVVFAPSRSYVDNPYQASIEGKHTCIACVILFKAGWLRATSAMANFARLLTPSGMLNLNKNIHRAWVLRNPVETPFVFTVATNKSQHLIWKAPVNYSNKLYFIQFGNRPYLIKPERLFETHQRVIAEMPAINEQLSTELNRKISFRDPFITLDRSIDELAFGQFKPRFIELAEKSDTAKSLKTHLSALSVIELWALGVLLAVPEGEEEKPEYIDLSDTIKKLH